jgi:hypothetical protein
MTHKVFWSATTSRSNASRSTMAIASAASLLLTLAPPAEARGGHGFGHGFHGGGPHGAGAGGTPFAGDRRHGNDDYVKAASAERDRLLNTEIKSICRGC